MPEIPEYGKGTTIRNSDGKKHTLHVNFPGYMHISRLVSGSGTVYINGVKYCVNSNDVIVSNQFDEVKAEFAENSVYQGFSFDSPKYFDEIGIPAVFKFANIIRNDRRILTICDNVETEYRDQSKFHERMLISLTSELLIYLYRNYSAENPDNISQTTLGKFKIARGAVAYINENCQNGITTSDISAHVNVSTSYLCRCFKEVFNTTPLEYSEKIRCRKAHEDLSLGINTVGEIAARYNFSSLSYFNRRYRKFYGVNPTVTLSEAKKRRAGKE